MMTIFLFSLAGIPPFAGWFAKFVMFRAVLDADTPSAVVLGVIAAVMLGGRVLLLRRGRPQDVVPRPGARGADDADARRPAGAHRRHRHQRRDRASSSACTRSSSPASASSPSRPCAAERRCAAVRGRMTAARGRGADPAGGADPVRRVRRGSRSTAPDGFFTRGGARAAPGATSSPAPRSGRCSARWSPRALDGWWRELGEPDPFVVVEAGAGRGRLARDVLARRARRARPALRYVLVERSAALRAEQRELLALEPFEDALGPVVRVDDDDAPRPGRRHGPDRHRARRAPGGRRSTASCSPTSCSTTCPFRLVERTADGWSEVRVGLDGDGSSRCSVPARRRARDRGRRGRRGRDVPDGHPAPGADARSREWLAASARPRCAAACSWSSTTPPTATELVARGADGGCARTATTSAAATPLDAPGEQDITIDVPLEYLRARRRAGRASDSRARHHARPSGCGRSASTSSSPRRAAMAGRARARRRPRGASRHRSRVTEAAALTDPAGLGAHRVLVFAALTVRDRPG